MTRVEQLAVKRLRHVPGALPPSELRAAQDDYARAMTEAGVAVTCTRYLGVVHDFVTLRPLQEMPAARAALRQGIGFLADALGTSRCGIDLTGR